MTDLLQALLDLWGEAAAVGAVVFLRIGAAMAILPAFGEKAVPVRIRLALALAFTAIVAPAVSGIVAPVAALPGGFLRALGTETVIGLSLGVVLRLMILALEIAGSIAAQSMSLSQLFGVGGEPMPAISHLLVSGGLALAVLGGLHVRLAEAFILSYSALPPARLPDAGLVMQWSVAHVGWAFGLAFSLAAPFTIAALIYNVALGAINRAMPQLMVAFVGAPALTAAALALLAVAAPLGLALWADALAGLLADPFGDPP